MRKQYKQDITTICQTIGKGIDAILKITVCIINKYKNTKNVKNNTYAKIKKMIVL